MNKEIDEIPVFSWNTKTKEFYVLGHKFDGVNSIEDFINFINDLQQKNRQLEGQIEYLKSGEYINQLRFERNMLQDLVDNGEVSKEDKEFIDMTHRNTELLEQLKQRDKFIDTIINLIESTHINCDGQAENLIDDIAEILQKYRGDNND